MKFLALPFLSCLAQEPSLVWILCGWQLVCQYLAEISRAVAEDSGTFETWLSCFLALKVRKVFLFPLFWSCCGDHEGATNVQIQIWKCFSQIPTAFGRWGSRCKIDVSGVVSVGLSLHLSPSIGVSWLWPVSFVSLCMPLSPTFTFGVFPRVSCFSLPLGGLELGPSSIYFPKYLSLWSSPFLTCLLIVACFLVSLLHITMLHNYLIFYFGVYNFERPRFTCCTRAPSKTCLCLQFSVTLCGSPILPSLDRMWWVL